MGLIAISGKIGSGKDTVGRIIQYLLSIKIYDEEEFIEVLTTNHPLVWSNINNHSKWQIKKFAGKLKQCVSIITRIPVEDLEKEEVKNRVLGEEWKRILPCYDIYSVELSMPAFTYNMTVRMLLQELGTEVGRSIHHDFWINALFADYIPKTCAPIRYIDNYDGTYTVPEGHGIHSGTIVHAPTAVYEVYPNWIITDCRFPNELQAVKDRGGITIRINRPLHCDACDMPNTPVKDCIECVYYGEYLETHSHSSETALDNAEFDYIIDNNGTIGELIEKVREILVKEKLL